MKTQNRTKEHAKKAYTTPKLVRYGEVRSLTQASTSGSTEGSGGSGIMKPMSERKLKENIIRVGEHPLGIGLYLFDYKAEFRESCGHGRQFGVMVDEVESVMPEAVSVHSKGYRMVDYGMLGIRRSVQ